MADKKVVLSGPMFQPAENDCFEAGICEHKFNRTKNCFSPKAGGHYNHYHVKHEMAMVHLRRIFPKGIANELNFVLFSTSGVHGTYATIEDVERFLKIAPVERKEDDWCNDITFVIIQPRLCTLHYGNCEPENIEDIEFLKRLRESSWQAIKQIGRPQSDEEQDR